MSISNTPATPLNDAQQAGFVLYSKDAKSLDEHITLLRTRGMIIGNENHVRHALKHIGYFRLSGYWYIFQRRDHSELHDHFLPEVSFDQVLRLYIFDRQLRLMILDPLERIEIAFKTALTDVVSLKRGPHWLCKQDSFHVGMNYERHLEDVRRELAKAQRSSHHSIVHYKSKYSGPEFPPSWIMMEMLSFGTVSNIFRFLEKNDRKAIARHAFDMPEDRLLSWAHALSHLRNVCAHHGRVWNRQFGVSPSLPKSEREHILDPRKFYSFALVINEFLKVISINSEWSMRLKQLLDHGPVGSKEMGFPSQWSQRPIWNLK